MAARKRSNRDEELRKAMQDAGIYEERFEFQVVETAALMDELEAVRNIIKREGRTITQTTYSNSMPTEKQVEHPLLGHLRALHKDIPAHLAALGLNFQSMKKADPKVKVADNDPVSDYFGTVMRRG